MSIQISDVLSSVSDILRLKCLKWSRNIKSLEFGSRLSSGDASSCYKSGDSTNSRGLV